MIDPHHGHIYRLTQCQVCRAECAEEQLILARRTLMTLKSALLERQIDSKPPEDWDPAIQMINSVLARIYTPLSGKLA